MSKIDSLKPISNYLNSLLSNHGLPNTKAKLVVTDMIDRLVTGGYGWDKVQQYHAKVGIGNRENIIHGFYFYREKRSLSRS